MQDLHLTRRGFFNKLVSALFGASGLAFFGSALAYLYPNRNFVTGTRQFLDISGRAIGANEIGEGEYKTGVILGSPAIVFRRNGKLVGFSLVCTHFGCTVAYKEEDEYFACPCHGGEYDSDGTVIDGPPPKPLMKLSMQVQNGKIRLA